MSRLLLPKLCSDRDSHDNTFINHFLQYKDYLSGSQNHKELANASCMSSKKPFPTFILPRRPAFIHSTMLVLCNMCLSENDVMIYFFLNSSYFMGNIVWCRCARWLDYVSVHFRLFGKKLCGCQCFCVIKTHLRSRRIFA